MSSNPLSTVSLTSGAVRTTILESRIHAMRAEIFVTALFFALLSSPALPCSRSVSEPYRFLYYPQQGKSASRHGKSVTIDTSFLDELIANPSSEAYLANDRELFYLLATGDSKAQQAGAKILSFLIKHPEFEETCGGRRQESYGIEELAFVFSRTDFSALCQVTEAERASILAYYKRNPRLAVGPERPWDATCK